MSRFRNCLFCALLFPIFGSANQPQKPRLDAHGFPLPDGSIARLGDLRFVPGEWINAVAVSPDGKLIASAGAKKVSLTSPVSGRLIRELMSPREESILQLVYSKSGRMLAAATDLGEIIIWNVANGKLHWSKQFSGLDAEVTALHFLDNDRVLGVAAYQRWVQLRDVKKGTTLREWDVDKLKPAEFKPYAGKLEFVAVALSPSGSLMAWLAAPRPLDKQKSYTVFLCETMTGRLLRQVKRIRPPDDIISEFQTPVDRIHFHLLDEGQSLLLQVASLSKKGGNLVFGAKDGKLRYRFPARTPINHGPAFLPIPRLTRFRTLSHDRKSFFATDRCGTRRWDLATGKQTGEWEDVFIHVDWFPDGKRSAVGRGMRLQLCDQHLKPTTAARDLFTEPSLQYLTNDRLAVFGHLQRRFNIWDLKQIKIQKSVIRFAAPEYGRITYGYDSLANLFAYNNGKKVIVRDLLTNRDLCHLADITVHSPPNLWPLLSPNGKRVLVSSKEKQGVLVRWYNSQNGRELGRYLIPQKEIFSAEDLDISWHTHDGTTFQYIAPDTRLAIVDCKRRNVSLVVGRSIPRRKQGFQNPDALYPAWHYQTSTGESFIIATRSFGMSLPPIPPPCGNCTQRSPQGRIEIAVWEKAKGLEIRRCYVKPGPDAQSDLFYISLSPDARLLAHHAYASNEVTFYETATGRMRGYVEAPSPIYDMAFSPNGKTFATSCEDTTVLLWDLNRPLSGPIKLKVGKTLAGNLPLWKRLGDEDAAAAEQAIWALVNAPDRALPLLQKHLRPVALPKPKVLQKLIRQLDSPSFKKRETAIRDLMEFGELAIPALRDSLKSTSLEAHLRIKQILHKLEDPARLPQFLRELRAIEVLECIGSTDARRLLKTIANGAADCQVTYEAQLALRRLSND